MGMRQERQTCSWCGEPVVFGTCPAKPGLPPHWHHVGGTLYVRRCRCGWRGPDVHGTRCPRCGDERGLVDDHAALPARE
jgi:hypothetical protein